MLPADGPAILSPEFLCLDHQWQLSLRLDALDGFLVVNLVHRSRSHIRIYFSISIRGFVKPDITGGLGDHIFELNSSCGYQALFTREKAIGYVVEGALMFEIRMKRTTETEYPPFIPKNPSECETVQDLYMDKETSDVVFEVGDTSPSEFYAHYLILKRTAPVLAELCKSDKSPSIVQIFDTSPVIFRCLLDYVYGYDFDELEPPTSTKDIIEAADKYGITNLKLKAEARYVSSTTINMGNMMENLHFADSKNCALLKEVVMNFIAKHKVEILEENMLKDAPEGLVSDVLGAIVREEKASKGGHENKLSALSINELRRRASEYGFNVDGSRETLISDLKTID